MSRLQPGQVRDAVIHALTGLRDGVTLTDLQVLVERHVGGPVSHSSVRSYLNLNTPRLFERTDRGRYRIATEGTVAEERQKWPEFAVGNSRLVNSDAFEWLESQPENSIHGVVTDPPYGLVEYSEGEQAKLRKGKGGVWRIPPAFDGSIRSPLPRFTTLTDAELREIDVFFRRLGEALLRILVPGAHVIIASNPLVSHRVSRALELAKFERRGEIIRLVQTMRGGDRPKNAEAEFPDVSVMPRSQWEPWVLFRKPLEGTVAGNLRTWGTGGLRRIDDSQPFGDVIRSSPTRTAEREIAPHPSLKPQAFLRQVVRAVLPLGKGVVYDPFAGSGSTLAAAAAVGYRSVGTERDPHYFELGCRSIDSLSRLTVS